MGNTGKHTHTRTIDRDMEGHAETWWWERFIIATQIATNGLADKVNTSNLVGKVPRLTTGLRVRLTIWRQIAGVKKKFFFAGGNQLGLQFCNSVLKKKIVFDASNLTSDCKSLPASRQDFLTFWPPCLLGSASIRTYEQATACSI